MTIGAARRMDLFDAIGLFAELTPDGRRAVADLAVEVDFGAGRVIARHGEVGTGFFVIETGAVEVIQDGQVVDRLGPGEFFGELSLLDHEPRTASVVASAATRCLALAAWDFEQLLEREPRFALAILRVVARRLRHATHDHRG
jgi:CRP/FNR family transcriptional regulator, cyclic AMP receptor protein